MRVVGKTKIQEFCKSHAQSKGPLLAWLKETEDTNTKWNNPNDIKERYAHASFLPGNTVIFNIGGNKYRLEVKVRYEGGIVLILDINTHANYDKKNKKRKKQH